MKHLITLMLVLLTGIHITAQHQTEVVQTLQQREETITAVLDGKINLIEWDEPFIQVKTTVYTEGLRQEIINRLVKAKRYKITERLVNGILFIEAPNTHKHVIIKDQDLIEDYEYEIYVPKGTTITNPKAEVLPTL